MWACLVRTSFRTGRSKCYVQSAASSEELCRWRPDRPCFIALSEAATNTTLNVFSMTPLGVGPQSPLDFEADSLTTIGRRRAIMYIMVEVLKRISK